MKKVFNLLPSVVQPEAKYCCTLASFCSCGPFVLEFSDTNKIQSKGIIPSGIEKSSLNPCRVQVQVLEQCYMELGEVLHMYKHFSLSNYNNMSPLLISWMLDVALS